MFKRIALFISEIKISLVFYWVLILAAIFLLHSGYHINSDEGVVLNGAWNLVNQRRLYFDFFEFIPPASFYLIYFWWKLFKLGFFSAQILANLIWFLGVVGVFKIGQLVYRSKHNYFIPPFLVFISSWFWLINHNVFNIVCLIWSTYFLLLAARRKELNLFFVSGLLTGLGILFLQQTGLVFLAATAFFLFIKFLSNKQRLTFKNLLVYIFGSLLPLLILFAWPLKLLYLNLVDFPIFHYIEVNRIPFGLFWWFWFFLFSFIFILRRERRAEIFLLIWLQTFLLLSRFPLPDKYHVFLIIFPLLSLSPLVFKRIVATPLFKKIIYSLIFFIFIFKLYYPAAFYIKDSWRPFSETSLALVDYLKSNCHSQYFYTGPFAPGLYFAIGKLSPSPFDFLITGQQTAEQFQQTQESLIKYKPDCALLIYPDSLKRFHYNKDNLVDNYIRDNYQLIFSQETYLYFYKLK
ncbi:MAG: glycosyltransferase family 39 protein [Candidatus Falkowbacteria bacterium]|nr:glycosyltransferase family 39 protein [Candidatus Falkowbacteria bacterium]